MKCMSYVLRLLATRANETNRTKIVFWTVTYKIVDLNIKKYYIIKNKDILIEMLFKA